MPTDEVWPPKPSLLDPLAEHDELIEARLSTLSAMTLNWELVLPQLFGRSPSFLWLLRLKQRLSPETPVDDQFLLIQVLREEKGLDLLQARATVRSYYHRHGMALTRKSVLRMALPLLITLAIALVAIAATFLSLHLSFHRDALLSRPNHGAAIIALDNAKSRLQTVSLTLLGLLYGFWFLHFLVMRLRHKRAAAPPGL